MCAALCIELGEEALACRGHALDQLDTHALLKVTQQMSCRQDLTKPRACAGDTCLSDAAGLAQNSRYGTEIEELFARFGLDITQHDGERVEACFAPCQCTNLAIASLRDLLLHQILPYRPGPKDIGSVAGPQMWACAPFRPPTTPS